MTTTFRADIVTGFTTMVQAFIVANPTALKRFDRVRPSTLVGDSPRAYLDLRPESIAHVNGVRTRTFSPSVVVVDEGNSNEETIDRIDRLTDLLVDWFTSYPHIVSGSIWDSLTVVDESEDLGTDHLKSAVRFTFNNLELIEGRT